MQARTNNLKEADPLCGSCGSSMSARETDWFCVSCVEYGKYVGLIRPRSPEHPAFYEECTSSKIASESLLLGCDIEYSEWGSTDVEYLGEITELGGVDNLITIEREPAEPFYSQTIRMDFEKFCDWWEKPTPWSRGRNLIEKEESVIFVI